MKHRFHLALVISLICFAVCEAALFVVSPAIQASFRFLGTLPGLALLAGIFAAMSVGCLIGIVLARIEMRFEQDKKSADP